MKAAVLLLVLNQAWAFLPSFHHRPLTPHRLRIGNSFSEDLPPPREENVPVVEDEAVLIAIDEDAPVVENEAVPIAIDEDVPELVEEIKDIVKNMPTERKEKEEEEAAVDVDALVEAAEKMMLDGLEAEGAVGVAAETEGEGGVASRHLVVVVVVVVVVVGRRRAPPLVQAQGSAARRAAVNATTLTRSLDTRRRACCPRSSPRCRRCSRRRCKEEERLEGIDTLVAQLGAVVDGKGEIVARETKLLRDIQALKEQTLEKVIRDRFDEAAAAKAELISIEMVLSETMVAVRDQLEKEKGVAAERIESMRGVLGGLPGGDGGEGGVGAEGADDESSNNLAAVRQYGFTERRPSGHHAAAARPSARATWRWRP